ncbi:hypothetical protein V6N13_110258 [Hibiscus sabdariffa]
MRWASFVPNPLPSWYMRRLVQPVRPHDYSPDVTCLSQCIAWCVKARLLAVARLLVVTPIVAARNSFFCCSSILLPWRASFPLVPWFANPCFTAGLLACTSNIVVHGIDITARPHCWPILDVPKIVGFLGYILDSPARPHCWPYTWFPPRFSLAYKFSSLG